ncbi:MAG: hypothetical protein QOJ39_3061 [Candidatus Eremiobacteraeota bacterium]|nr:hypothetical protein [Candidatus Eremiobacteraeota bacterium]MEA2721197.1 hypothetical protein [Candidatus Eremiobacteraeota bacterium]
MRPHSIIRVLAAAVLIGVPSIAMAAPDQNTNNGQNNGCNGRWVNGQCVSNGQWNNGRGNNNNGDWQNRNRDRAERDRAERERAQRERDRWQREHANGNYNNGGYNNGYNNGGYNNGGYNNGGYNNGGYNNGYGNRGGQLTGTVSSFSPYNLYLNNNVHVTLHDGTVINPTGTNLTPGQRVRIIGTRNGDGTFSANEIDVVGTGGYNRYLR